MIYRVYFKVTKKYYVDLAAQSPKEAEAIADHHGEQLLCDGAYSVPGNTSEVDIVFATLLEKQNPDHLDGS